MTIPQDDTAQLRARIDALEEKGAERVRQVNRLEDELRRANARADEAETRAAQLEAAVEMANGLREADVSDLRVEADRLRAALRPLACEMDAAAPEEPARGMTDSVWGSSVRRWAHSIHELLDAPDSGARPVRDESALSTMVAQRQAEQAAEAKRLHEELSRLFGIEYAADYVWAPGPVDELLKYADRLQREHVAREGATRDVREQPAKTAEEWHKLMGERMRCHLRTVVEGCELARRMIPSSARAYLIDNGIVSNLGDGDYAYGRLAQDILAMDRKPDAPQVPAGPRHHCDADGWDFSRDCPECETAQDPPATAPEDFEPRAVLNGACPECAKQHWDEGEWATRPHRTHRCVDDRAGKGCGHEWRAESEDEAPLPEGDSDADRVYYALYNAWAASPMDTPQEEFYHHARNAFQRLRALLGASAPDPRGDIDVVIRERDEHGRKRLELERRIERAVVLLNQELAYISVSAQQHARLSEALAALRGTP